MSRRIEGEITYHNHFDKNWKPKDSHKKKNNSRVNVVNDSNIIGASSCDTLKSIDAMVEHGRVKDSITKKSKETSLKSHDSSNNEIRNKIINDGIIKFGTWDKSLKYIYEEAQKEERERINKDLIIWLKNQKFYLSKRMGKYIFDSNIDNKIKQLEGKQ